MMENGEEVLTRMLIRTILDQYTLPTFGIHGVSHWARVMETGLKLARKTGANTNIVKLFAVFHDSKRTNESRDNEHGLRGGNYAASLRDSLVRLSGQEFDLLYYACKFHTDGLVEADITVQTCWDSDRLDLNRVKIVTNPKFLCTQPAKDDETISWAMKRAENRFLPEFVRQEWGIV